MESRLSDQNPQLPWADHAGQRLPVASSGPESVLPHDDPEWVASRFLYSLRCLEVYISNSAGIEQKLIKKYSELDERVDIHGGLVGPLTEMLSYAQEDARIHRTSEGQQVLSAAKTLESFVSRIGKVFNYPTFYTLPDRLAARLAEVNRALGRPADDITFDGDIEQEFFNISDRHHRDRNAVITPQEERAILLRVIGLLNASMLHMQPEFQQIASGQGAQSFARGNHYFQPPTVVVDLAHAQRKVPKCFFETFEHAKRLGLLNVGGKGLVQQPERHVVVG